MILIFVNDLPNCLNEGFSRTFADDTNISFGSNNLINLEDLKQMVNSQQSLNIAKTEFMDIGSRQRPSTSASVHGKTY